MFYHQLLGDIRLAESFLPKCQVLHWDKWMQKGQRSVISKNDSSTQ